MIAHTVDWLSHLHRKGRIWLLVVMVVACLAVWAWVTYAVFTRPVHASRSYPSRTESSRIEGVRIEPVAAQGKATELSEAERRRIVEAAIGPAPSPDAVPVLGYTTKGGIRFPHRWRTKPDADLSNNFKRQ